MSTNKPKKYYIFFHLIGGRDVRATVPYVDLDLEDTELQDRLAAGLTDKDFYHFVEDGKLVIVNMRNVAYIRITEAG